MEGMWYSPLFVWHAILADAGVYSLVAAKNNDVSS